MRSIPLGSSIFHVTYSLLAYRAALGLPWHPVDDADFQDDPALSPWVQLSLDSLLAA